MLLDTNLLKKTGIFSLVTGEVISLVGAGYFLGSWFDSKWNTAPLFLGFFVFLGLAFSVFRINKWYRRQK